MVSYTSQPNIPTLSPVTIYPEDVQPLQEQLQQFATDVSNIVNDKKRRYSYLLIGDITNDVWVDGKAIFTKTIPTGVLNQGATNTIPHGITTIDRVVDAWGTVKSGNNNKILEYASPTASNSASLDIDTTNIVIVTGATFGVGYNGYVVIFYTKV